MRYVPVSSKSEFLWLLWWGSVMLADFYSMADYSTTVTGIPIRFMGGY